MTSENKLLILGGVQSNGYVLGLDSDSALVLYDQCNTQNSILTVLLPISVL